MTTEPRRAVIEGPYLKKPGSYLHPQEWYGSPVPADKVGPWGLNGECWWYRVRFNDGGRRAFAAEDPDRAYAAAVTWLREHGVEIEAGGDSR